MSRLRARKRFDCLGHNRLACSQLGRGEKLLENAWINPADYDQLVLDTATAESEVVAAKVAVRASRAWDRDRVTAGVDRVRAWARAEAVAVDAGPWAAVRA